MNLYLVERTDKVGWDQFESFVIACDNEEEARKTHPRGYWDDKLDAWIPFKRMNELEITYLGKADPSIKKGIITSSFNNG